MLISEFRIQIDAKVDDWYEEYSSGSIFSTNNFDKIWQNWFSEILGTRQWCLNKNRRWGRSLFLKRWIFNIFLTPKGCLIKSFVSLRFRKFLEFTQGPLQGRSPPPLTPHPCTASPLLLPQTSSRACPPECSWGGRTLTKPLSNVRDYIFIGDMSVPVCPSTAP